jgi:hypothetical protein
VVLSVPILLCCAVPMRAFVTNLLQCHVQRLDLQRKMECLRVGQAHTDSRSD